MITKSKKSISLSTSLLKEITQYSEGKNVSEFVQEALTYYMYELKKRDRGQNDIEIIKANAQRFNKEAEENLEFQAAL